ncbi:MAG: PQQ-binding-like beta-propeller repeat protein [Rhodospirillaceae bacterium]
MRLGQTILFLIVAMFTAGGSESVQAEESRASGSKMKCVASAQIENDLFGSGDEAWAFYPGRDVFCTPAVRDGMVYLGAHSSYLYALSANSEELRWRRYLGGAIYALKVE